MSLGHRQFFAAILLLSHGYPQNNLPGHLSRDPPKFMPMLYGGCGDEIHRPILDQAIEDIESVTAGNHNLISAKLRFRLQVARLLWPSNGTFTCFAKRSGAKSGEAVLGGVTISYSLRSSSSGVGFWKKAIHGFMASLDIRKLSLEGRKFLSTSRLNSSSSGTSR